VVPADEAETRQAVRAIVDHDGPVYLRLTRQAAPNLFDDSYRFSLGRVVVVRPGADATVFATGTQTVRAFQAAEALAAEGIDLQVVHVPTLKPLDADAIIDAARATGFVITSEEGSIVGGLGGAVAEVLGERFPLPLRRHGLADTFGESGPDQALLEKYGLSVTRTAEAFRAFVRARGQ
jgi:transketolase